MNSREAEIQHERDLASKVAEVKIKQAKEKRLTEVAQYNMQTKRAECEAVTKQKEADAKARAKESESQARIVESNNSVTVKESADQVRIAEATARTNVQYYKMIERVTDSWAKCNSKDEREQLMAILQKLSDPGHQKRNQRKPRPRQGFNQARLQSL